MTSNWTINPRALWYSPVNANSLIHKAWRGYAVRKHLALVVTAVLCLSGCKEAYQREKPASEIVGAWVVKIPGAPFPLHVFVFHSDGTVEQSNPDAGDPNTSDSNLMGVWQAGGDGYRGKLVEITADRVTHQFASRGEISFAVKVDGNSFVGSATAAFFDPDGRQIRGPTTVAASGERVML
jgi:hypothetical protein